MLPETLRVARKELAAFFASPVAYIFLGSFLVVTLFVFFWADAFFARNIADVRPLFQWLPLLLIFLVAALTMRMWSEERRMGTIEHLLTLPVRPLQLLAGKFLAGMALLALALLLTLPLPLTVSFLGPLDWGPVWGGYLATLFLGAAYLSIGLFLSSRSDNQIVSLISTVLVCGLFYLLGSNLFTGFFDNRTGEILKLLGSGSRFSSITRGVIDLRDLYYYLSLVGVFFTLTLYSLERLRWAKGAAGSRHRLWGGVTLLLVTNLLVGNLWLQQVQAARIDLTAGKIYSISPVTRQTLAELQEPLLIRGYFSAKTHPLLAPLVPRLRDLIREYQIAGHGKVRAEFIDPQQHPALEAEANQKYGIKPVPFQVADRYQSSLVNSYFDLLVQYGDQYQVLKFSDLIDVKQQGRDVEVELRNPEYALTRAIRKVLAGFQGGGDLFAGISRPVTLTGYISADAKLPKVLRSFKQDLTTLAAELQKKSGGKFSFQLREPEADGGALARKIETDYGFGPMQAGLLGSKHFYFYLTLGDGEQTVQVALPDQFTKEALNRNLTDGLKRFASGYLKTVGLAVPQTPSNPYMAQFGLDNSKKYTLLRRQIEANHNVISVDLNKGRVPEAADILVVADPQHLTDKGLFALDQYLMKGGTVLMAASPYQVRLSQKSLDALAQPGKLEKWLQQMGLTLEQKMVLDPRNQPFPVPVNRTVNGFTIQELQLVPYPYFIDARDDGLNQKLPITAGLNNVLVDWASPIKVDAGKTKGLQQTWLLKSSPQAWTTDNPSLVPYRTANGQLGFTPGEKRGTQLLGVSLQGRFDSYFKGKPSPLLTDPADKKPEAKKARNQPADAKKPVEIAGVIDRSSEAARLVLFGSSDFISDQTLQLAASARGQQSLGGLQLMENAVDWSLEDPGLLSIRSRGHYARTLEPLARQSQMLVEYLDYGLALGGLLLVFLLSRLQLRRTRTRYQLLLEGRA